MKYGFEKGCRLKGDPQVVGEELERIRKANGEEVLEVETVIKEAKKKSSPLHSYFEWNDKRAAQEYRVTQSRHLIRSIMAIIETDDDQKPIEFRAFVARNPGQSPSAGYQSLEVMMRDNPGELLQRALAEIYNWQRRYSELKQLEPIFRAVDEVLRKEMPKGKPPRRRERPKSEART